MLSLNTSQRLFVMTRETSEHARVNIQAFIHVHDLVILAAFDDFHMKLPIVFRQMAEVFLRVVLNTFLISLVRHL